MERRVVLQLVGETIREIGVLTLVFAPLESLVPERSVDIGVPITLMLGGFVLIACGILLEAKNRWT
jgi:hypothetical protein